MGRASTKLVYKAPVLGPTAQTPAWMLTGKRLGTDAQGVLNAAMRFMDPTSQAEVARYLASQNKEFQKAGYGNVPIPPPAATNAPQYLTGQRLREAAGYLAGMHGLRQETGGRYGQYGAFWTTPQAQWIKEYLQTAAQGVGEGPAARASRAAQAFSAQRLKALEGTGPGQYLETVRRIVHPSLPKAPTSGAVGTERVVAPPKLPRNVGLL